MLATRVLGFQRFGHTASWGDTFARGLLRDNFPGQPPLLFSGRCSDKDFQTLMRFQAPERNSAVVISPPTIVVTVIEYQAPRV